MGSDHMPMTLEIEWKKKEKEVAEEEEGVIGDNGDKDKDRTGGLVYKKNYERETEHMDDEDEEGFTVEQKWAKLKEKVLGALIRKKEGVV